MEEENKEKEKFEIKWQATEFFYYQKNVSWYWLVLIFGIVVMAFALWQKNFLFAVFIVFALILLFYWGRNQPRSVKFKLNEKGLEFDKKLHSYEDFEYFAINENTGVDSLNQIILKTKGRLKSLMHIYIEKDKMAAVKKELAKRLEEHEYEESLIDSLLKIFRF